MVRTPNTLEATMSGQFTVELFSVVWTVVTQITREIRVIPGIGPILATRINNGISNMLNDLMYAAPAVTDWWIAISEAPAQVSDNTAATLWTHKAWLHWIADQLVVFWYNQAVQLIIQSTRSIYVYIDDVLWPYINSEADSIRALWGSLAYTRDWLEQRDIYYYEAEIQYTNSLHAYEQAYVDDWITRLSAYLANLIAWVNNTITQTRDELESSISSTRTLLQFEIAALGTFIVTTAIPGALVVFKTEQTAEIVAGMDTQWPLVAKSIDASTVTLALFHPTTAARALTVPPEPIPGLGGEAEAVTAALSWLTGVTEDVTIPMMRNLEGFGKDIASLRALILPALLGGFTAAAVADPVDTAAMTDAVLAEPLSAMITTAAQAIGLTDAQ